MSEQQYDVTPGYYPSPWSGEDGGPQRLQAAAGVKGLDIKAGESLVIKASRRLSTGNMPVLLFFVLTIGYLVFLVYTLRSNWPTASGPRTPSGRRPSPWA